MKHKFFAISARHPEAGEEALDTFCSQHKVSFVEKQLVMDGEQSFWSVCVTYQVANSTFKGGDSRKPKVDYKKILSTEDFGLYLELHALRKEVAERQAVPAYAVFTNEHLAAMVQQRINSKSGLEGVSNIGSKRIEHYGEDFLQKLNEFWARDFLGKSGEAQENQS
uniref:HRDC domain-containing protein n=1 Tax=uncultured Thiotrichaceae bacterium TaxID=298394 RepID=A0A6S6U652_9GAMM|nr:MAG: Unknown protein [uncultured Thiotrichaceae bacterium]